MEFFWLIGARKKKNREARHVTHKGEQQSTRRQSVDSARIYNGWSSCFVGVCPVFLQHFQVCLISIFEFATYPNVSIGGSHI